MNDDFNNLDTWVLPLKGHQMKEIDANPNDFTSLYYHDYISVVSSWKRYLLEVSDLSFNKGNRYGSYEKS